MAAIARSDHTTYCPYKGEASYFSIPIGGERSTNAVWTYETPFPAMAAIKDYVAFYPDRVDDILVRARIGSTPNIALQPARSAAGAIALAAPDRRLFGP